MATISQKAEARSNRIKMPAGSWITGDSRSENWFVFHGDSLEDIRRKIAEAHQTIGDVLDELYREIVERQNEI